MKITNNGISVVDGEGSGGSGGGSGGSGGSGGGEGGGGGWWTDGGSGGEQESRDYSEGLDYAPGSPWASADLTSVEIIRENLLAYNKAYYDSLYKQACYQLGEKLKGPDMSVGDGDFPVYQSLVLRQLTIGQSRRILNNSLLAQSKILTSEPEPEFPDVDKFTSELRKQFFLKRYRGQSYGDGNWSREIEQAWQDGFGLGIGFIQIGLRTNPMTGYRYVHAQHVPATQVLWDEHEETPGRAKWIAFVHYVDPEEARALYGEAADKFVHTLHRGSRHKGLRFVRVTEYFDLGCGSTRPTYAVFIGPWAEEPVVHSDNPFGCLPIAYLEYAIPPGMSRPVGAIMLQMSTQEALNELEGYIRGTVRNGVGPDVVDTNQVDPQDLKRWNDGDTDVKLRLTNPDPQGKPAIVRVQNKEISQSALQWLSMLERDYNDSSNSSDWDRGNMGAVRSATEAAILDQRTQAPHVNIRRQTLFMYQRLVDKTLKVATKGDRDPVPVDIFGHNALLNDPEDPNMRIDRILEEPSSVLIAPQSVESADHARQRSERLALLQAVTPFVGQTVDPIWYTEELLKAIGEKDVKSALLQQAPMPVGPAGAPENISQLQSMAGIVPSPESTTPGSNMPQPI